jgi:hypothetical protein
MNTPRITLDPIANATLRASWIAEAQREYRIRRARALGLRGWASRYERELAAASALVAKRDLRSLRGAA